MKGELQRHLDAHDGLTTWSDACRVMRPGAVYGALQRGEVAKPFRGVVADPAGDETHNRLLAALMVAGPESALSHTTALSVWQLPVARTDESHVMTGPGRRIRVNEIVAHRRKGFVAAPPMVVVRSGLRITNLPGTLVDAWPLLAADEQRAPLILAVSDRRTTVGRVRVALDCRPKLPGFRAMSGLLDLIEAGCRSELELYGYTDVFVGPGFENLWWQVPVRIGARTIWLDAYDPESATNFELDGRKYHDSPRDRERDLRRDALLDECGIHPVRYTHTRLHHEPADVRRQARNIMATRRGLGQRVHGAVIGSA